MKWQSSLIRYRHRQSGSTAYRLQARLTFMGPGLRLTAIPRPDLPFNCRHPCDPRNYTDNYTDHYSFTDPGGMEGWVGLVSWPTEEALPTKWSHVNHGSGKVRQRQTDVLTTEPSFLTFSSLLPFSGVARNMRQGVRKVIHFDSFDWARTGIMYTHK